MENTPKMRAKLKVLAINKNADSSETLILNAVPKSEPYDDEGNDENNTFAQFTPTADLQMVINNPVLAGSFKEGQEFYVDFTEVEVANQQA